MQFAAHMQAWQFMYRKNNNNNNNFLLTQLLTKKQILYQKPTGPNPNINQARHKASCIWRISHAIIWLSTL